MAPPEVCASSRAPRRPRTTPFTSSRCSSAARRPRRVAKPSRRHRDDGVERRAIERRGTARRGAPARTARLRAYSRQADSATICCASTSSGASYATIASSSPRRTDAQQRRAFDEIVARHREHPALRRAGNRVAGSADPLQQRGDPVRRSDLADQVDVADVDAELERRRRDERPQRAGLQPRLRIEALLLREAAVMRRHGVFAEALAQVPRQPLRHAAACSRRRASCGAPAISAAQPIVVLLPDFVRHHRIERRARASRRRDPSARRCPTSTIAQPPRVAGRRNRATSSIGFCVADRPIRRSGRAATCCEPLERQREVRAAARANHRVDLVDDHRADRAQHLRGCAPTSAAGRATPASSPGCAAASAASPRARPAVVSPVRTAAVIRGAAQPGSLGERAGCRARGSARFL